jgi:hypothetical protein
LFDQTTAVVSLAPTHVKPGIPDTDPFGLLPPGIV